MRAAVIFAAVAAGTAHNIPRQAPPRNYNTTGRRLEGVINVLVDGSTAALATL